jgi:A nuclease family of the HNH/ENDO VII superfamily with conserved AHH
LKNAREDLFMPIDMARRHALVDRLDRFDPLDRHEALVDPDAAAHPDSDSAKQQPTASPPPPPAAPLRQLLPPSQLDPHAEHQHWGEPPEPSGLHELPPAPVAPPPSVAPVIPVAPPAPPSLSAPTASTPAPVYIGERPVDAAWLQDRQAALNAVRADYQAQRAQAQAQVGQGPGWVDAVMVSDESGQQRSASGAATVFLPDPGASPTVIGYDESGPVYGPPAGRHVEFSETAFAAQYRAQAGPPLQQLATLYSTDAPTLMARHPELLDLALTDHALNAGPPPPGRAMGDAAQLGMLDLYMADPQIAELIATRGGTVAPSTSGFAQEQVRLHGQARYEQLTRLGNAMGAVRSDYSSALMQAQASGQGPGWIERQRTITVSDESGGTRTEPMFSSDESGARTPIIDRVFDPDTFTRWYIAQDGASPKAFAQFYGQSHTQWGTDESGRSVAASVRFDNPNWQLGGAGSLDGMGGSMSHTQLVSLDPNHVPRLNDGNAVGFDLEAGWATHHSNIYRKRDWVDTLANVVFVAAVSWFSVGTLGPAVAGGLGFNTTVAGSTVLTAAGVVVSASVVGAAGSLANGLFNGNVNLKDILKGALAGGLTAGLLNGPLGAWAQQGGAAGTIALRATVQGGIQALLGGKFEDGALVVLASGLADLAQANLTEGIDKAVANGSMGATEAMAARTSARILGSALRALGNPDNPQYAFASAFVSSVVNDGLGAAQPGGGTPTGTPTTATAPPALDDEGNLMPGVVDASATPEQQLAQLTARLQAQGLNASAAAVAARQALAGPAPLVATPGPLPPPAQTFPIDGPGSQAGAPLSSELRIDGRLVQSTQYDAAGQLVSSYHAPDADRYTLTLGAGHGLARDASGSLVLLSAEQAQTQGLAWVAAPGQTVVGGAGAPSLWVLPAGASPELVAAASSIVIGWGQRSVLGAMAEGAATAGRVIGGVLLDDAIAALPRVLGVAGLLLVPSNVGQGTQVRELSADLRHVTRPGELLGQVEFRVVDVQGNAQWMRAQGLFDFEQAQQLANGWNSQREMLTPEEVQRLTAPTTLPMQPPGNTSPPPLPADTNNPQPGTPGYVAAPPAGPSVETLPAAPPVTANDLIIEQRNSQILGDNLRAAGVHPPDAPNGGDTNYEAHHIVPSRAGGSDMDVIRDRLVNEWKIDLNSAANGVWLPGPNAPVDAPEAYHRTLNNRDYNEAVISELSQATSRDDAIRILADIAHRLRERDFPGATGRP